MPGLRGRGLRLWGPRGWRAWLGLHLGQCHPKPGRGADSPGPGVSEPRPYPQHALSFPWGPCPSPQPGRWQLCGTEPASPRSRTCQSSPWAPMIFLSHPRALQGGGPARGQFPRRGRGGGDRARQGQASSAAPLHAVPGQPRPGQPGSARLDVQPLSPGLCPQVVESGILDTLPAEERKRQEVRGRAGAQPAPQPRHRGPRGPPTHRPPLGQTPGCWLAPLAGWGQGQPPSLLLG